SGTETFGNAPLEALASGLPVAGVSCGGVTEFLLHGRNALLCAVGDYAGFTENLAVIMDNAALRRELSENGEKTARSRNWDFIFAELVKVYSDLIQSRRDAAGSTYRDASAS
ncbi:MAG: glycosyltransferase, partial [Treponema sp.]|nr:glycosyltransferase [Treponema sp.]